MKFEYSAGAFVYFIEDGKPLYLLLKREQDTDIPKGHIEKGETALEAAKREVKEETGLEPFFLPYFSIQTKYFFYEGKEKVMKTVKFFIAKSSTKSVKISAEHVGYAWLDQESMLLQASYKDIKEVLPKVYEYVSRYEAMSKLNEDYAKLPEMSGWQLSKNFVPGEGPLNASIMLVGQAPGKQEDEQRRPFVGRSGLLLNTLLKKAGIKRDRAYITSVVQFYPPGNREPSPSEIALCLPFLKRQIDIIKPKFILLLGNVAIGALLGKGSASELHGKPVSKDGITYFPTFHPAAALRFPSIRSEMEKDLKKFAEIMKAI